MGFRLPPIESDGRSSPTNSFENSEKASTNKNRKAPTVIAVHRNNCPPTGYSTALRALLEKTQIALRSGMRFLLALLRAKILMKSCPLFNTVPLHSLKYNSQVPSRAFTRSWLVHCFDHKRVNDAPQTFEIPHYLTESLSV